MVDLAASEFVFGLVMGWSALFIRPGHHGRGVVVAVAVWSTWLAMVAALAVRLAIPGWAMVAGVIAGALAHAVFRRAIAVQIASRRVGR